MIVGDKKLGSVVARSLKSRQLANAPNPVTGQAPGEVTASNIQARRAEDVKGGGSEVIRDVAEDIESTFKSLDFTSANFSYLVSYFTCLFFLDLRIMMKMVNSFQILQYHIFLKPLFFQFLLKVLYLILFFFYLNLNQISHNQYFPPQ